MIKSLIDDNKLEIVNFLVDKYKNSIKSSIKSAPKIFDEECMHDNYEFVKLFINYIKPSNKNIIKVYHGKNFKTLILYTKNNIDINVLNKYIKNSNDEYKIINEYLIDNNFVSLN